MGSTETSLKRRGSEEVLKVLYGPPLIRVGM